MKIFSHSEIALVILSLSIISLSAETTKPATLDGYFEFNYGKIEEGVEDWTQAIRVTEPTLRSDISGTIEIKFQAKGMSHASAYCWQHPMTPDDEPWGKDINLTPEGIILDSNGNGSFEFPANNFPNGPTNIRIYAKNEAGKKDIFELQLFNTGGTHWNQGIPQSVPAPAKGMKLIFEDDFDGPLSISKDGIGTTYHAHKPGGGDFSGWKFTSPLKDGAPFEQTGTWLKIAARKDARSPKGRSGIIASVDKNFKGVWVKAPCYLECRLTAQSAIGTWPAFWTLSLGLNKEQDELDILEGYGGKGKGNPNHPGYSIVSHFWKQKNADGTPKKKFHIRPDIMNIGGKSYWSTTFHTYGVYVGLEETVYYFDDIEVLRHPTNNVSRDFPHYFLINYAIGGISRWPIDLSRYDEGSDMWVDYVRVFAEEEVPAGYSPNFDPMPTIQTNGIALNFAIEGDPDTTLAADRITGISSATQKNWNNLFGSNGQLAAPKDHTGETITETSIIWEAPEDSENNGITKAEPWGFKHSSKALQLGAMRGNGSLKVIGIPYEEYDVYVYASSGVNTGAGSVKLTTADNGRVAPEQQSLFYKIGWFNGKFSASKAKNTRDTKKGNVIVFKDISGDSIKLDWKTENEWHWTGITGIQIVQK
ncbi:glycoside hydrolase family 16 protein [Rubellicoccus peritrichatus]|uniref:Family 16 glycosylhydrolase n=1 Tax=Rubellicoccus peritrichatus TaxID=3080537 RepID=A0AAQ3LF73_9BACT|nr:family 16 glycosylhydrolase [Puniceicoccus sp. CR14]WOO43597.1 family 16 glycosylhydrolase [Puniceicoccus sp. CR14]